MSLSSPPPLLPSENRGPQSLHSFYCHNPYSFNWLWNALAKMTTVVSAGRLHICVWEAVFSVAMHKDCTVNWHVCPVHCSSGRQRDRVSRSGEGEYPCGSASKNVPCFISSQGWGEGGGCREATILVPFVYVRSGSRVLGEQRSLGMSGLHGLGIACFCLVLCIS